MQYTDKEKLVATTKKLMDAFQTLEDCRGEFENLAKVCEINLNTKREEEEGVEIMAFIDNTIGTLEEIEDNHTQYYLRYFEREFETFDNFSTHFLYKAKQDIEDHLENTLAALVDSKDLADDLTRTMTEQDVKFFKECLDTAIVSLISAQKTI